jgi:hypothetical protein
MREVRRQRAKARQAQQAQRASKRTNLQQRQQQVAAQRRAQWHRALGRLEHLLPAEVQQAARQVGGRRLGRLRLRGWALVLRNQRLGGGDRHRGWQLRGAAARPRPLLGPLALLLLLLLLLPLPLLLLLLLLLPLPLLLLLPGGRRQQRQPGLQRLLVEVALGRAQLLRPGARNVRLVGRCFSKPQLQAQVASSEQAVERTAASAGSQPRTCSAWRAALSAPTQPSP